MTAALVIVAAAISAIAGMFYECCTGRFEHFMRRFNKRYSGDRAVYDLARRNMASHEEFLDDCEQYNKAMIATPLDARVFEAPDTLQ